jgi:hypothetical protein
VISVSMHHNNLRSFAQIAISVPDLLCVTSGQFRSFKLVEDASNRLRGRLDYHSVLKDESHNHSE